MKIPRHAQWTSSVVVSLGLAIAPVSSVMAAPGGEGSEARPTVEGAPESEPPSDASPGDASGEGEPAPTEGEPTVEGEPAASEGEQPTPAEGEGPTPSDVEQPTPAEGEGPTPSDVEQPTPAEGEQPATEEQPEPETVTVRPRPVADEAAGKPIIATTTPESATDDRRTRADERLLLRASYLSFGVAGAAIITSAVGAQRAVHAGRVLGRDNIPDDHAELNAFKSDMTTLAYVAGAVAGVQLITGAVLLGVALRKPKQRNHALAPTMGRGHVGLTWRARF